MPIAAPARCGCRWSSMHRHGPVRADLPLTAAVAAAVAGSAGAAAGSAPGLGLVAARGPDPGLQSVLGWLRVDQPRSAARARQPPVPAGDAAVRGRAGAVLAGGRALAAARHRQPGALVSLARSEEHTSELQSLMRIS